MTSQILTAIPVVALTMNAGVVAASGGDDHDHDHQSTASMIEQLKDVHAGHEHGHDFEALEAMSEEDMERAMRALRDIGLVVPSMDSRRGAEIFLTRGCIACHHVNGVGGEIGPSLDATGMPENMNAFEFAARMWRGAGPMVAMQEDLLGGQIELDGRDLADLVAFVHDESVQAGITRADIPERFLEFIGE